VPIIAPVKHKKVEVLEREALKTRYSNEFLTGLMGNPDLIRNVAIVGHLHHGKTLVGALGHSRVLAKPETAGESCHAMLRWCSHTKPAMWLAAATSCHGGRHLLLLMFFVVQRWFWMWALLILVLRYRTVLTGVLPPHLY